MNNLIFIKLKKIIPSWLQNKYLATSTAFAMLLIFFDNNTIGQHFAMESQINKLKMQKQYFVAEIQKINQALNDLNVNNQTKEKYAREAYLMKQPNEDVFVIEHQK